MRRSNDDVPGSASAMAALAAATSSGDTPVRIMEANRLGTSRASTSSATPGCWNHTM